MIFFQLEQRTFLYGPKHTLLQLEYSSSKDYYYVINKLYASFLYLQHFNLNVNNDIFFTG